ncbi:hypothetical protein J437_LFUL014556, partial [Ladona fulva]
MGLRQRSKIGAKVDIKSSDMEEDWDDSPSPAITETQGFVDYGTGYGRGRGIIKNNMDSYSAMKSYGSSHDDDNNGFGDSTNNNFHGSSSFGSRGSRGNRGGGRGGRGGSFRKDFNRQNEDNQYMSDEDKPDGFGGGDSLRGSGRGRGRGRGGGSGGGEEQKPKENYIPPEPSNDENEIFGSGISSGINFAKYDSIKVNVSGENAPKAIETFEQAGLRPLLLQNVKRCNYRKPTPVQKHAIPIVMAGRDLMACAQTGSGKTAAYLLPIIHNILENPSSADEGDTEDGYGRSVKPLAVVVVPTRELAIQIFNEARKFAHSSVVRCVVVYGGTSTIHQSNQVR